MMVEEEEEREKKQEQERMEQKALLNLSKGLVLPSWNEFAIEYRYL